MDTNLLRFLIINGVIVVGLISVFIFSLKMKKAKQLTARKLGDEKSSRIELAKINSKQKIKIDKLENKCLRLKELLEKRSLPESQYAQKNIRGLLDNTKIEDIMTKNVISINMYAPFADVPKKMKKHSIRHLPVVDDKGKLVGIITQRMVYKIKSPRKLMDGEWYYDEEMLNNVILQHVMVKDVYTLTPENTLGKVLIKVVYSKFGSIPIIGNDNKLCGIVTRNDILKVAVKLYEENS